MTTDNTDLTALLAAAAGALTVLAGTVKTVLSRENKSLRAEIKRERAEHVRIQKALDESTAHIEQLLAKLREVQAQMTDRAIKDVENSHIQLCKMQDVIADLEAGRIKNGEAIAALRSELAQAQNAFRRATIRINHLISENRTLCEKLEQLGFEGDQDILPVEFEDILNRGEVTEDGITTWRTARNRRGHDGAGGYSASGSNRGPSANGQTLLAAS